MELIKIKNLIEMDKLYSEYQPLINSTNNEVFAYEALMRTTPKINPLTIIEHAQESELLFELDKRCIINAIKGYPSFYLSKYQLFINVFPSTIIHADFENFIKNLFKRNPEMNQSVVFEINETEREESIWKEQIFLERLILLKKLGFGIALDDLSLSKSSLTKMELFTPDFVKLDHYNAKYLSKSKLKQQLIAFFLEFTNERTKLVLEGIEEKDDLLVAKQLGVHLLQGYYISKPHRLK